MVSLTIWLFRLRFNIFVFFLTVKINVGPLRLTQSLTINFHYFPKPHNYLDLRITNEKEKEEVEALEL